MPKRMRQLRVKDLPKVSNMIIRVGFEPSTFQTQAPNLPLNHHTPHCGNCMQKLWLMSLWVKIFIIVPLKYLFRSLSWFIILYNSFVRRYFGSDECHAECANRMQEMRLQ